MGSEVGFMKLLIASDIHGSAKFCKMTLDAFAREGADKLVLLGDILYHGPRNPLPEDYSPQDVAQMLSAVKEKVICLRGNCDAEIDQTLLPFPVTDYSSIFVDGLNVYLSHGHRDVPPLIKDDIYVTGHTHVPLNAVEPEGYYHLNPGSVSLPKDDSRQGYILYNNRKFTFKTLEGETYDELNLGGNVTRPIVKPSPAFRRKIVKKRF